MVARGRRRFRRGTTLVEGAVVLSVLFILILGMAITGMGVYYYQQVAAMAREGARYASVHGAYYAKATGQAKATPATVYANGILPRASGLPPSRISYAVTWDNSAQGPVYLSNVATNTYRINYVTVTVSFSWLSQGFEGSAATTRLLHSTSRIPMSY